MKLIISIYIILFPFILLSQENQLEKGVVLDSIWIDKKPGESFALYLPTQYDVEKASPAIFIFEPMARGSVGIQPFISASEQYGYILICSNDSKNGPYEANYAVANNLFSKAFSMLHIDQKRIYTSGFSGGGRLAASIAIYSENIQGVVSCGAGFNLKSRGLPTTQKFSYVSIMGDEDMNYYELQFTESYLKKTQIPFELFTYGINHRWPSQDQILLAFDWMQLQAYKKQLILKNNEDVERIYNKFYELTIEMENGNSLIIAADSYRRILKNFERYYNLDSIQEKYKALNESKAYKNESKKNVDLMKTEGLLTDEFLLHFNRDLKRKNYSLSWWENRINKIKKKQDSNDQQEVKMYNRLLNKIFALAIETARYDSTLETIQQKMLCYDICILVYPSYALPYYQQMHNSIALGDKNKSLDYLEKLLATGYEKKELKFDTIILENIQNSDRFKELIKE